MCLTKRERLLKGRRAREAEHPASLPVVLTPSSPAKWVTVGGGDDGEKVVGV